MRDFAELSIPAVVSNTRTRYIKIVKGGGNKRETHTQWLDRKQKVNQRPWIKKSVIITTVLLLGTHTDTRSLFVVVIIIVYFFLSLLFFPVSPFVFAYSFGYVAWPFAFSMNISRPLRDEEPSS